MDIRLMPVHSAETLAVPEARFAGPRLRHVAAACLALGALRFVLKASTTDPSRWPNALLVVSLLTAYWIPATLAIGHFQTWLIRRRVPRSRQIAYHVIGATVVVVTEALWSQWIVRVLTDVRKPILEWIFFRLDWTALLYLLVITTFAAVRAFRIARARERMAMELDAALTDAQLHGLALQLQPHFLFNTLLLIAETAYSNADVARRTLAALRTLLRTAYAYGGRRFVTVAEEIAFLEAYAAIQQHRFGTRLSVRFEVDPDTHDATLPPLLLQPLVENAIRHGISPRARGGHVRVSVRRSAALLDVTISDDGQGLRPGASPETGIGLSLTRRRLAGLYGDDASLRVATRDEGGVEARVTLPYSDHTTVGTGSSWPVDDDEREEDWGRTGDFSVVVPEAVDTEAELADVPNVDERPRRWNVSMRLAFCWAIAIASIIELHWLGLRLGFYQQGALTWHGLCADSLASTPFWLLLTLAAVEINRKVEAAHLAWPATVALHAIAAMTVAAAHGLFGAGVEQVVWWGARPIGETTPYYEWAPWDLIAYALVVGIVRTDDLTRWARKRVIEARTLRQEVAAAARRLARLRLQQPLLISALEGVANADGALALDQASVKFADLVRLLLASADADSHTLSAEIRLTDHYAALRTRALGRVTMSRAASDAEVPPGVVPAVLHALLIRVDDPDAYRVTAGAIGDVLTISVAVSSEMPVSDRSAAGDTLQRWLLRQLDAACDARAELSFGEHEKEVEAVLRLPYAAPPFAAESPECDYSPDDHLCLVIDHAIARAGASVVRQT